MKKLNKKDYILLGVLIGIFLAIVLFLTHGTYLYGSKLDWASQHYIIPEYFRTLFYDTKQLIPSFALNLGGGQNIFNFAYYGLLSPIILISYALPFIKMIDYIMVSSILIVISSVVLLYKWLRNNSFSSKLSFIIALLFLLASPLIFQSHRHIMFINYMPFLILCLIGVDKYFKDDKWVLLIISLFLLIMTSYFYSIGSIIVIIIYGIYNYLLLNKNFSITDFFKEGFRFIRPIVVSILMSSILLIPVLNTIIGGRANMNVNNNIFDVIIPDINLQFFLYSSYSIGLCSVIVFAIIGLILSQKKQNKFLGFTFLAIILLPIITYLLNGGMYINPKSLIPFLPLCCFSIGIYLKELLKRKINIRSLGICTFIITILFLITTDSSYKFFYLIDVLVMFIAFVIYYYKKIALIVVIPIVGISLFSCFEINSDDELVLIKDYANSFNSDISSLIDIPLSKDHEFYRIGNNTNTLDTINKVYKSNYYTTTLYSSIYNKDYNQFYYDTFGNEISYRNRVITNHSSNVIFNMLMGEKYLVSDKQVPIGYKEIKKSGKFKLYQNDNVLPLGYSIDKLLSENEYEKLKYPYNMDAILNYGIVNDNLDTKYKSNIRKYNNIYKVTALSDIAINKTDKGYHINALDGSYLHIDLNDIKANDIIIVSFNMNLDQSCSRGDTAITINDIQNKLTCSSWKYHNTNYRFEYVISSNPSKLNIRFDKGEYLINDIKIYKINYNNIKNINKKVDKFIVNNINGNNINGSINVKKDGYFILNIPYDKGFNIKVNGNKVKYEKVNDIFIGFKLNKGFYNIDINYQAKGLLIGKILSLFGFILLIIIIVKEKIKKKNSRK